MGESAMIINGGGNSNVSTLRRYSLATTPMELGSLILERSSSTVPAEEPPPEPTEPAPVPATTSETPGTEIVYENLRKEEIINCICGYTEEDGLMIQCDLCLCWQHGQCNKIDKEADVPEKYVCYICNHPARERLSTHYLHNQDWLKEGKLPTLSFRSRDEELQTQRESMLKKSHDLTSSLLQLQAVIRSLRIKSHIAKKSDHPKLYLWAKSWKDKGPDSKQPEEEEAASKEASTSVAGPQPEAAIDETECRFRLLEHVEDYQQQVDDRLTSIQAQIAALESEDPDVASDEGDHYPVTKQTLQMLMRDLDTLGKVAAIN